MNEGLTTGVRPGLNLGYSRVGEMFHRCSVGECVDLIPYYEKKERRRSTAVSAAVSAEVLVGPAVHPVSRFDCEECGVETVLSWPDGGHWYFLCRPCAERRKP